MTKRKNDSSSDNGEVKSTKKSNSINQSYIQTANLMSKTKLFDRGLSLNPNGILPNIKVENPSERSESEDVSPKSKKKSKSKNKQKDNTVISDNERESTIALLLNETKEKVLKNKSKKSSKHKNQDLQNDAVSMKVLANIKSEIEEEYSVDSNEAQYVDTNEECLNGNDGVTYINQEQEDENIVSSVEKKIHLLQDIRLIPVKDLTAQEQLNELYPKLRKIDLHTKMKVKDSVDVYLLHVPKSVNPENLLNSEINLEESCRVNIDGDSYTIKPTSNVPDPTLVLNNKTEILHFKKNLVLEKYIKANKEPKIPSKEKFIVPLPSHLKNRHPLFGSNYEDRIQLDETIEEKLDEALKNLLKPSKSKKHKKVEKANNAMGHSTLLPDVSLTNDFSFDLSSISSTKKTKKIKQENDDYSFIADLFKTEDQKQKKQKISKNKKDIAHSEEVNDEIKVFKRKLEPLDSSPKKKKKKK